VLIQESQKKVTDLDIDFEKVDVEHPEIDLATTPGSGEDGRQCKDNAPG